MYLVKEASLNQPHNITLCKYCVHKYSTNKLIITQNDEDNSRFSEESVTHAARALIHSTRVCLHTMRDGKDIATHWLDMFTHFRIFRNRTNDEKRIKMYLAIERYLDHIKSPGKTLK